MPLTDARAWLTRHRNADGSWGYVPGDPGAGEATLLASASGQTPPLDWLATADLGWSQLMVPFCLEHVPGADALLDAARELILGRTGVVVQVDYAFDPSIPAWPWFPGTSPWVEPTSYAVLSLRRMGMQSHERCEQGVRMLLDRQCADGGWNYGNPEILGAALESDLTTTARAALALPTSEATARALTRLEHALEIPSTEHLSLAALAHVTHGADPSRFIEALVSRQQSDGGFTGRVDRTALAAMAMAAAEGEWVPLFVRENGP